MTSFYPNRGRPAIRLALDGSPKRTIFGNLSSFIHRTCPWHLNLSLIIVIESEIEPQFLYSLLFELRSVSQIPRTIHKQFLWKLFSKSSSAFPSTHSPKPYLTTVITVASNILILVCTLIILIFQTFF